jgi:hypothetical protein
LLRNSCSKTSAKSGNYFRTVWDMFPLLLAESTNEKSLPERPAHRKSYSRHDIKKYPKKVLCGTQQPFCFATLKSKTCNCT